MVHSSTRMALFIALLAIAGLRLAAQAPTNTSVSSQPLERCGPPGLNFLGSSPTTFRVSGTVVREDNQDPASVSEANSVRLQKVFAPNEKQDGPGTVVTPICAKGRFEFSKVGPGKYQLVVVRQVTMAPLIIDVTERDVTDLRVVVPTRGQQLAYKGFTIDTTAVGSMDGRDAFLEALRQQIDIVDAVELKTAAKQFLRSVRLDVILINQGPSRDVASYFGDRRIVIRSYLQRGENPILLHELLHAYHDQKLQGGFDNPDIERLYRQAKAREVFAADAYVLSNVREYFAMMASVYLNGSAGREPFTRENIRVTQPDCYEWLEREFGARR